MISVIMSVYNESAEYLKKSIESILFQTYADFEYIIVLDNPGNNTAKELLESYSEDKRIKLIYNEKNIGLTASLNKALKTASGEFIARMDADDISEKDRLEVQYKYINENKLDLIGAPLRRISENGDIVNRITNNHYSPDKIMKLLKYDDCIAHPTWFVRRTVYDTLKGYRDIYSCEDYDFLLRALKEGFKIGTAEKVLLSYRINTGGISRTNSLRQMLSASYLQKNFERINDVDQKEIDEYLSKRVNKETNEKYERANQIMNDVIEKIKIKKFYHAFRIFVLPFISPYILINIRKIVRMLFIKKYN